jgi:hypothetical protein
VLCSVGVIVLFTFTVGVATLNLRERDPSKLSSSLGAIVTTMVIFGYLLLVVLALAVPFDQYFKAGLYGDAADDGVFGAVRNGVIGVSLLLMGVLWRVAQSRFARKDI